MKNPKKIPFGFKLVIAFIIALSISILYLSNPQTLIDAPELLMVILLSLDSI